MRNPFNFRHVQVVKSHSQVVEAAGPAVVMATPSMLQNGLSRDLFEMWCAPWATATHAIMLPGWLRACQPALEAQCDGAVMRRVYALAPTPPSPSASNLI